MAGIDPTTDPRGARWEARLHWPVLTAAWLAIPTVILYFSKLGSVMAAVATGMAWGIWLVFLAEAVIMLSVVADRRAWARGHLFGLAILAATFPLLTHILEGLLAARALSGVQGVRILQVLYVAKAAKIIKSVLIVRRAGRVPGHPALHAAGFLLLGVVLVGIGDRIVSGEKHPTPFHGTWDLVSDELAPWSFVVAGGLLAAGAALALSRRDRGAPEA
ncbi:MAG: hypothetical protein AB7V42_00930 [Thermoleophilia bacterium]